MTLIHEPPSGIPIAEAAEISGVSTHTLRYYERAGLVLTPVDRASSSHRRYSPADLSWVAFLTRLRMTGMPIAGIRRYTELVREGASSIAERRELLVAHREHAASPSSTRPRSTGPTRTRSSSARPSPRRAVATRP